MLNNSTRETRGSTIKGLITLLHKLLKSLKRKEGLLMGLRVSSEEETRRSDIINLSNTLYLLSITYL
jgi:hypothetical protein